MTDDRHRVWDIVLRGASSVALVIAFVVGLYQYAESREREYYFELWKEKKQAYLEFSRTAATAAYTPDNDEYVKAYRNLQAQFDGSFQVVANREVWGQAVLFTALLSPPPPGGVSDEEALQRHQMKIDELEKVTRACNRDLLLSWSAGFNWDLAALKKDQIESSQGGTSEGAEK